MVPCGLCPIVSQEPVREELKRMIEHDRKENQAHVGSGTKNQNRKWDSHRERLFHGAEIAGDPILTIQMGEARGEIDQQ